jgi:hypothetical protein
MSNIKLWKIKDGATNHLRSLGYFNYDESIDGLVGVQCGDYRDFDYSHIGLDLINTEFSEIGISTDWLIPLTTEEAGK